MLASILEKLNLDAISFKLRVLGIIYYTEHHQHIHKTHKHANFKARRLIGFSHHVILEFNIN